MKISNAIKSLALAAALALPMVAGAATVSYTFNLSGSDEVPPNLASGAGSAQIVIDDTAGTITFVSASFGLVGTPAGALIQFGAEGVNGPAVFDLAGSADIVDLVTIGPIQIPGSLALLGISKPIDVGLALLINAAPSQYYMNILTNAFPDGQIRGQLAAVPVPAALLMFGPALLGFVGIARRRAA